MPNSSILRQPIFRHWLSAIQLFNGTRTHFYLADP